MSRVSGSDTSVTAATGVGRGRGKRAPAQQLGQLIQTSSGTQFIAAGTSNSYLVDKDCSVF